MIPNRIAIIVLMLVYVFFVFGQSDQKNGSKEMADSLIKERQRHLPTVLDYYHDSINNLKLLLKYKEIEIQRLQNENSQLQTNQEVYWKKKLEIDSSLIKVIEKFGNPGSTSLQVMQTTDKNRKKFYLKEAIEVEIERFKDKKFEVLLKDEIDDDFQILIEFNEDPTVPYFKDNPKVNVKFTKDESSSFKWEYRIQQLSFNKPDTTFVEFGFVGGAIKEGKKPKIKVINKQINIFRLVLNFLGYLLSQAQVWFTVIFTILAIIASKLEVLKKIYDPLKILFRGLRNSKTKD